MVFFMNVTIKPLSNNPKEIEDVKKFLFKMIKLEFGYGYVPEWHQDIVNLEDYYINPERNNFFVAYYETGEIIGTIGIRAYDKDFPEFRHLYSKDTTSSIWRLFVDRRCRRCGLAFAPRQSRHPVRGLHAGHSRHTGAVDSRLGDDEVSLR